MAAGVTAAGWEKLLEMEVQQVFNARLSRVVDAERAEGGDGHDTLSALRLKRAMRSAPTPQRQLAVKMGSPPKKPHKGRGRDSEAQPMPGKWPGFARRKSFSRSSTTSSGCMLSIVVNMLILGVSALLL